MATDDSGRFTDRLAQALQGARFDPQHSGELFLRADAEKALKAAAGAEARVYVAGRDDAQMRAASFLGATFRPDLVVERQRGDTETGGRRDSAREGAGTQGREGTGTRGGGDRLSELLAARGAADRGSQAGERVAVTLTVLRSGASPIAEALAGALVLSRRYGAVVAFILDRRLQRSGPFGPDIDELVGAAPAAAPGGGAEGRRGGGLAGPERELAEQLWAHHRIRLSVRKQDPFGF